MGFNQAKHKYYWDKQPIPSVSAVLDVIDRSHALIPWAVGETITHIRNVWLPECSYSAQEIHTHLEEARNARKRKSGEAAGIGTSAHKWIERYVKSRAKGGTFTPPMPEEKQERSSIEAFLEWERNHTIEYLESELRVAHSRYLYAGTIDLLARVDGKLSVIDFKTSRAIYLTYYLQVASYFHAYCAYNDWKSIPEQGIIVRIPKDDADFEVRNIDTSEIDLLIDVFLAAKKVYHFTKEKR